MNHVIYFNQFGPNNHSLTDKDLLTVADKLDICRSWGELIESLTNHPSSIKLVLVHKHLLEVPNTTVNEIVDSITTVASLVKSTPKVITAVIVNAPCQPAFVQTLKKSNINGIVPDIDQFGRSDFVKAVSALVDGETTWDEKYVLPKLKKVTARHATDYGIRLTNRQQDIMQLIANRGLSNKKIAQVLNISESTVKVHISAILKAYGVRNRTQLALAGSKGLHA